MMVPTGNKKTQNQKSGLRYIRVEKLITNIIT